jgi:predicted nucleic acid-binding protein
LLDVFEPLLTGLLIPPAVAQEVAPTINLPTWCSVRPLAAAIPESIRRERLGPGETEAIALSIELRHRSLLLDELRGRRIAASLGMPVIGTAGLLVRAKREGLVGTIRPHLEALLKTGFYVSRSVIELALHDAGE